MNKIWLVSTEWFNDYLQTRYEKIKSGIDLSRIRPQASCLELCDGYAVINISGVLTEDGPDDYDLAMGYSGRSYAEIQNGLTDAHEALSAGDPIYINVDTPGGDITGVEATHNLVRSIAAERPVHVVINGMMASAGVWITAGATTITANGKLTFIGSIGVACTVVSMDGLLADFGIKVYDLTNRESKDKRPDVNTEEGREVVIAGLDDIYELFMGAILSGRSGKTSREPIEALHGRVVLSEKAKELGLIDSIDEPNINITSSKEMVMTLADFLKENPDAQAELDALMAASASEAREATLAQVKENVTAVTPYLAVADYPEQVKTSCLKAVTGELSLPAAKEFVALYDTMVENQKASDAAAEAADIPELTPADPSADIKTQLSEQEARIARIKEVL